jgi:hypothetical protein
MVLDVEDSEVGGVRDIEDLYRFSRRVSRSVCSGYGYW